MWVGVRSYWKNK